jgi:predicted enzyme related to lactoylglutathione lyase
LGNVIVPVPNMDQACKFYERVLGLRLKFRDDHRWAAFGDGAVSIALAGLESWPDGEAVAIGIHVLDVESALERAVRGGATLQRGVTRGAHEISAAINDPVGHPVVLYTPFAP